MRIISFAAIRNYAKKHADADVPLRDWYKKTEKADWSCLADTKQTLQPKKEIETGRKSVLPSYKIGFSLKQKHTVLKTCRNIRIIRRISFFRNMFINTINKITKKQMVLQKY